MRRVFFGLAIFFAIFIVAARLAAWQSELWWFEETGYAPLYLKITTARWSLFFSGFALWLLILAPHLARVGAAISDSSLERFETLSGESARVFSPAPRTLRIILRATTLFLAACGGWWASLRWMTWLAFFHSSQSGQRDAILGRDLSFWLFRLPAWQWLWHFANVGLWLTFVAVFIGYQFSHDLILGEKRRAISPRALRHLSFLGAALLIWKALGTRLGPFELLLSQRAAVFGGGWTDIWVRMPLIWILGISALLGAVMLWRAGARGEERAALRILGFYVLAVFCFSLIPILAQRLLVAPDAARREAPFVAQNEVATRRAHALDAVRESQDDGSTLSRATQISTWPAESLRAAFNARESGETSRVVADALHFDSYKIGKEWRPVWVAAREPNGALAAGANWRARHLQNTHGDGLWLCDANRTDADGAPLFYPFRARRELYFADFPEVMPRAFGAAPISAFPVSPMMAPASEPAAPFADAVVFDPQKYARKYARFPGVPVGTSARKWLLALGFGDAQMAANLKNENRLIWHRRVLERCRTIAPFLWFPERAVPVAEGGRVTWLANGFTASRFYPQSQPEPRARWNYLRHAVVASVDAFDGEVKFYIADPGDSIIQTFARAFPDVFLPLHAMPKNLRRHLRYSPTLLQTQSEIWARFHPNRADENWRIADMPRDGFVQTVRVPMQPQLSSDGNGQVQTQMLFSPQSTGDNSVVAALRGNFANGHNLTQWRPARATIGAPDAARKITNAPEIKELFGAREDREGLWRGDWNFAVGKDTLWAQGLATAQKAQSGAQSENAAPRPNAPRLQKVAIHFRDRVWIAASLDEALAQIARVFPDENSAAKTIFAAPSASLILRRAREQFEQMQAARAEGDWKSYEKAEAELKRLLEK